MPVSKFKNEPLTDYSKPANRAAMEKALARVRLNFGKEYPLVIGGEEIRTENKLYSYNPSKPTEVVGIFQKADVALANRAVEAAAAKFEEWKWVDPKKRADYLFKAAKLMRKRKHEFSAVMVYEVGKTWPEADADTAEAIDFMDYYAHAMLRLAGPQPVVKHPQEKNELQYINSFKMKISVIIGVAQMIIGIILKGLNAIHFKSPVDFLYEFIPQLIFMVLFFGYMNAMIIIKWLTDWSSVNQNGPAIITLLIGIPLKGSDPGDVPLYGAGGSQKFIGNFVLSKYYQY